jgi:alpha,alpha-trehalase
VIRCAAASNLQDNHATAEESNASFASDLDAGLRGGAAVGAGELLAADGMRHFGDMKDATRVSREFMATVRDNFGRDHTIRERYNVVTGSSGFRVAEVYTWNEVGFGWTNGVYLEMETLVAGGK